MRIIEKSRDNIIYRLYAHNINDKDIWVTEDLKQNIKYWMENNFKYEVSCEPYIHINKFINDLERDLEKLKALRVLDLPSKSFESEIGSKIFGAGDFYEEVPSINTLVSYIENMIKYLEEIIILEGK